MAGIGFELRRILRDDSYLGVLKAYGYAGLIASGPWILSIVGVLLVGVLSAHIAQDRLSITTFQVSVTYLIAFSLMLTGLFQLLFTRIIADMLFAGAHATVMSALMLMLAVMTLVSAAFAALMAGFFFRNMGQNYVWLMAAGFVELSDVWILTIMATSIKNYKGLSVAYLLAYSSVVVLGVYCARYGLDGYLAAFDAGQAILLVALAGLVTFQYPGRITWPSFLSTRRVAWTLVPVGLFFNAAVWADKLLFWWNPQTGGPVLGPLRASPLYDGPIFVSYLLIVPGLAVFLMRLETDFVEAYDRFYSAIREGGLYAEIASAKAGMVSAARRGFLDIAKVQGAIVLLCVPFAPRLLSALGYGAGYTRIFDFDVVGVSLQLLFMSILNVYFYLDRRDRSLLLVTAFLAGNVALTLFSLWIGPLAYGSGFMVSLLIVDTIGLSLLDRDFADLEYRTFMATSY